MDSAQALRYGLRLRNTLRPCKRPIRRGGAAGLQSCLVHHQSSADECRTCWRGNRSGVGQLAAALALRWGVWNYPERFPYVYSERLHGTCGWTKLEAELAGPPPTPTAELPGSGAQIRIVLRQEGAGTSWFDDLEVKVLSAVS